MDFQIKNKFGNCGTGQGSKAKGKNDFRSSTYNTNSAFIHKIPGFSGNQASSHHKAECLLRHSLQPRSVVPTAPKHVKGMCQVNYREKTP